MCRNGCSYTKKLNKPPHNLKVLLGRQTLLSKVSERSLHVNTLIANQVFSVDAEGCKC